MTRNSTQILKEEREWKRGKIRAAWWLGNSRQMTQFEPKGKVHAVN